MSGNAPQLAQTESRDTSGRIDALCDRFEAAWKAGREPAISAFLGSADDPQPAAGDQELLVELIKIDLWYRWRPATGETVATQSCSSQTDPAAQKPFPGRPRLEQYVAEYPQLGPLAELPTALIAAEYRARRHWGDRPQRAEYASRFPQRQGLDALLDDIDRREPAGGQALQTSIFAGDQVSPDGTRDARRRLKFEVPDPGAALSVAEFIERLSTSRLLSGAELTTFQERLPADQRPKDTPGLAQRLIVAGKLTEYQLQAVLRGEIRGLVLGEYTILDKLGAGGMGQVFQARHRAMKRLVALKVLAPRLVDSPEAVERFRHEAEAAARLLHPNVVTAFDAGEYDGTHYLVMEYVDGQDLASLVKQAGPLPVEQAVEFILQAANGLEYAHKHGVIHRDIKPANLLVDKEGTVKILDMGLARLERQAATGETSGGERLTASGQVMGTCDYMAPEQALDTHAADARSDVYSLGCTLYRLLTGKAPYHGGTFTQVFAAHLNAPIPSLCAARPEVRPDLDAVFQKMVAKQPEARYQTMAEVMAALRSTALQSRAGSRQNGTAQESHATPAAPKDAELDEFLHGMASGTHSRRVPPRQASPAKPAPADDPHVLQDASGQHVATDMKVDASLPASRPPKGGTTSAGSPAFRRSRRTKAGTSNRPPWWRDRRKLAAAGAAGLLLVLLGVWVIVRDKEGKVVARVPVPEGGSATIETMAEGEPVGREKRVDKAPQSKNSPTPKPATSAVPDGPDGNRKLSPGAPISKAALVTQPQPIAGVRAWSVEVVGHRGEVVCPAYSPDGSLLATCALDGTICLWDAKTDRLVRMLLGHEDGVTWITWSPDGKYLASTGSDRTVRYWEAATGRLRRTDRLAGKVYSASWSPDGQTILVGTEDAKKESVLLCDVASGKTLRTFPSDAAAVQVAWSPDGRMLAALGESGLIRVWDAADGKLLYETTGMHWPGFVAYLAWSPNSQTLAFYTSPGTTLSLWDKRTGTKTLFEVWGMGPPAWSSDGKKLVCQRPDVRVLDVWDVEQEKSTTIPEGSQGPFRLAWSPDGATLAGLWRMRYGTYLYRPKSGWRILAQACGQLGEAVLSPDGRHVAYVGAHGGLRVWAVESSSATVIAAEQVIGDHDFFHVWRVSWSGDGKLLASRFFGNVSILDTGSGKVLNTIPAEGSVWVCPMAWSPDGSQLATGSDRQRIQVSDVCSGKVISQIDVRTPCLAFSPDGRLLVAGADKDVTLCDIRKGSIVKRFAYGQYAKSVTWSPDGKAVAACGGDQPLRAWEIESGREIAALTTANVPASAVYWCSDGKRLFAWGPTGLKTLDSQTGKVLQELPGYGSGGRVRPPSISADGRLAAFSYWGRSLIRLFRLADGQMLGTVLPMVGGGDVFISPDGHYRGPEGVEKKLVYVVETDAGQETLTPEEFAKRYSWKNDPAKVP